MKVDIEKLVKLAGEATPGPYQANTDTTISVYVERPDGGWVANISIPYGEWRKPRKEQRERKQAEFFAALEPEVIKALCEVVVKANAFLDAQPTVIQDLTWHTAFNELSTALEPFSVSMDEGK